MEKILFIIFFMFAFSGCQGSSPSSPQNVNQLGSAEQLEQEVLNAACDETIKEDYRKEIEQQRRRLSEDQLRRSLANMKRNIRCG